MTTVASASAFAPALNRNFLAAKFEAGLSWDDYLATGKLSQQEAWKGIYNQITLTDSQRKLLADFKRDMHVICISGIWCGDCVQQGPLLQRIAEASERISLVWLDRDQHKDLAGLVHINQGARVPTVLFLAEDDEFVSLYGDRTLTRYRALADSQLGPACPLPGAPIPTDQLLATLQDWLDEFERIQLLLRLSPRLRQRHND
ncbi:MAG: thioredoxin family protein [Phycisphaerales bacterium]|nr:thioredoxin family protein [Phycisphaerales bacterium]